MSEVIPEEVALFITERIENVAELEGLLILRQDPSRTWNPHTLATRLYISEEQSGAVLQALSQTGLAIVAEGETPQYSYGPESRELDSLVVRIAEIYSRHIVPVTNLIHSKAKHKVQGFADAFRIRKDDDEWPK